MCNKMLQSFESTNICESISQEKVEKLKTSRVNYNNKPVNSLRNNFKFSCKITQYYKDAILLCTATNTC